jgi:superfamily II DNA or RNA helicase
MKILVNSRAEISGAPVPFWKGIEQALTIANPEYLEAVRFHRWTGGIPKRLKYYGASGDKFLIPRGYLPEFLTAASAAGLTCEIEDQTRALPEISFDKAPAPRDYQKAAIDPLSKTRFGVLTAPTGSGKTVMALAMVALRKQPALVLVHTKELLYQWRERANEFLGIPAKEIGIIGDGKFKIGKRITVATVQSVYKRAEEIKHQFGHLIVDECHRAPSRTFTEAVTAFDCRYVLGLSATPYRRDKLSELIFWFLGPLRYAVPEDVLIKAGQILEANVVLRPTGFASSADLTTQYAQLITDLTEDEDRNELIARDVKKASETSTGVSLVISDRVPHCEALEVLLQKYFGTDAVGLLTGPTKSAERLDVIRRLDSQQLRVLVATGQLIGEGFDCKWLTNIFLCTPIKFQGRLVQYLGRVLRPAPGKPRATIYDYIDEQLWASARERISFYTK